jgi:hypothetical protein
MLVLGDFFDGGESGFDGFGGSELDFGVLVEVLEGGVDWIGGEAEFGLE